MRILYVGTPAFAVPSLQALLAAGHKVIGVFTQPDRPKGRGKQLAQSPVKNAALAAGLAVYQPERIRRPEQVDFIRQLAPELGVVVGYGQIIPQSIIDVPRYGILNVHASLLPKYRGAAPIQWAIANGETSTGVTIMQIDAGLDTGDMLLNEAVEIGADETAPELSGRLSELGSALLVKVIGQIEQGQAKPEKQDDAQATLAPILKKDDGLIDWSRSAHSIYDRMRAFNPWPGASTTYRGQKLSIIKAHPLQNPGQTLNQPTPNPPNWEEPKWGQTPNPLTIAEAQTEELKRGQTQKKAGEVTIIGKNLSVQCGENTSLTILEVQLEGKRPMAVAAFLNGYSLKDHEFLGGKE